MPTRSGRVRPAEGMVFHEPFIDRQEHRRVGHVEAQRDRRDPPRQRGSRDPPRRRRTQGQGAARCGARRHLGGGLGRDQIHPTRRNPGAQEGHHPLHRGVLRFPAGAGERHGLGRREAGHHDGAPRPHRPPGRGHLPGALLGELPRHGQDRRRDPGTGRARGRLLHPADPGYRAGRGLLHQARHHQQPQQPVGSGLPRGVHRRHRGLLRAARAVADHGRHLPPSGLRRPQAHQPLQIRQGPQRELQAHPGQRGLQAVRHDRVSGSAGRWATAGSSRP